MEQQKQHHFLSVCLWKLDFDVVCIFDCALSANFNGTFDIRCSLLPPFFALKTAKEGGKEEQREEIKFRVQGLNSIGY